MQISLENITKRYSLKTALDGVSVVFKEGCIHALVGENGAGKSTLAAILAGSLPKDSGKILIDGKEVYFNSPEDSLAKGIVMVAQRPLLCDSLSAKENIYLALCARKEYEVTKLLLKKKVPPLLEELRQSWCPSLNLEMKVRDMGGNLRFYVSLLSSLMLKPECLILDEPSVFLDEKQRQVLYERLRGAADEGRTVIVITHSSSEAQKYCTDITFLKNGRTADIAGYWDDYGRGGQDAFREAAADDDASDDDGPERICLSFDHISARPKNRAVLVDAGLTVSYAQITAVSGMKEAALDTLEDILTGMNTEGARGRVDFFTKDGQHSSLLLEKGALTPRFLRQHKTAIVPSDRVYRSSNPNLTIEQLLSVYDEKLKSAKIDSLIKEAQVNIRREDYASSLSGGMLQRLILVRELSTGPDFVILCNPLQGLDVHAQKVMTERIFSLAKEGKAVLIIGAADFPLSLCQRVYTIEGGICTLSYRGELV